MRHPILIIALFFLATSAFAEEWSQPARELATITASNYEQWLKAKIAVLVKPDGVDPVKPDTRPVVTWLG